MFWLVFCIPGNSLIISSRPFRRSERRQISCGNRPKRAIARAARESVRQPRGHGSPLQSMTLRQHEWPTLEQSLMPSLLQHFVFTRGQHVGTRHVRHLPCRYDGRPTKEIVQYQRSTSRSVKPGMRVQTAVSLRTASTRYRKASGKLHSQSLLGSRSSFMSTCCGSDDSSCATDAARGSSSSVQRSWCCLASAS